MTSPRSGATVPTGAHARNSGGKKGRSGRKPDEFRAALAKVRDTAGMPLLEQLLAGEVTYTLRGICSECGKESKGDKGELLRITPSPDVRTRALELALKHTLPAERIVRVELEGFRDVARAFDVIKARIRALLAPEQAEHLINDIQTELRTL